MDLTEEACSNTVDLIIKNGGHAISIGANVANENEIKPAMEQIISKAAWGGMQEMKMLIEKTGIGKKIEELGLPEKKSNNSINGIRYY